MLRSYVRHLGIRTDFTFTCIVFKFKHSLHTPMTTIYAFATLNIHCIQNGDNHECVEREWF